jgi:hypothetical protein
MGDNTLFGLPLWAWGVVALGIGTAYLFVWPKPHPLRQTPRTPFAAFMLRWGHALVWASIGAGCFLGAAGYSLAGQILAALAVPLYLVFMVVFVQDRQTETLEMVERLKAKRLAEEKAAPQK